MTHTYFRSLVTCTLLAAASATLCNCPIFDKKVDTRINIPVGETPPQSIIFENATRSRIVLIPSSDSSGTARVTIGPGEKRDLPFIITDEENQNVNRDRELILDVKKSSPFFTQPDEDLQLLARFGKETSDTPIRIEIGRCLLKADAKGKKYLLRVQEPPEAGLAYLDLCGDD